ncbi:MAG: Fe-S cluster assembly protein SufD [Candidatus Neomarinimicrobiota bacterium]|nr:Fe-S cluster assembly protein SufD [Candidatus Neomarinimicrobiota bacterium]
MKNKTILGKDFNFMNERWRFSPIKDLQKVDFFDDSKVISNSINRPHIDGAINIKVHNGEIINKNSIPKDIDVKKYSREQLSSIEDLGKYINTLKNAKYYFEEKNALDTKYFIIITTKENQVIKKPIHLCYEQKSKKETARIIFNCKKNSQLTVIESYINSIENSYKNSVIEYNLGQNCHLDHYCIQNGNNENWLFYTYGVIQGKNSTFNSNILSLSGFRNVNEIHCDLTEEGAQAEISGLYISDKKSHRDIHTKIVHSHPKTYSSETFKGILTDESSGIFNGIVVVEKNAQMINSQQINRNLLLSKNARIKSNPQLEIYADDVKCTHGSTIGQIDDDALFYMRSRGISEVDAMKILVKGFAGEIIDKIKIKAIIEYAETKIENIVGNNK